jgi:hypothetical protein
VTDRSRCTHAKARESNTSQVDAQCLQTRSRTFEHRRMDTATLFALETRCYLKPRFPLVVGLRTGRRMLWMSFLVSFEDGDWWWAVWIRCGLRHRVDRRPCAALRFLSAHWASGDVFCLGPPALRAMIHCLRNNHTSTLISFCIGSQSSVPSGAISCVD